MYGSMGDHMPPPPPPPEPGPLPGPTDNPNVCPVCGFIPCADHCRLGLNEYDLEDLNLMWFDWQEDDVDEHQA